MSRPLFSSLAALSCLALLGACAEPKVCGVPHGKVLSGP
jgi:hypothetical protein